MSVLSNIKSNFTFRDYKKQTVYIFGGNKSILRSGKSWGEETILKSNANKKSCQSQNHTPKQETLNHKVMRRAL